ncbi:PS42 protein, partial [Panaeolus papilionaceus]
IKRPPNSFFIFRSEFRRQEIGRDSQSDVSKLASIVWKRMSNEDKRPWYRLQLEVKAKHNALYPGYKYRP